MQAVSESLIKLLQDLIDAVKDQDINQYYLLRDLYRQEMLALKLLPENSSHGIRNQQQLLITPECYKRYYPQNSNLPETLLGTLYTAWGQTIAACVDGDILRALLIKPPKAQLPAEQFALAFVGYHEGCYYLQQGNWQKAVAPLNRAKDLIRATPDWHPEIDRLCLVIRNKIDDFEEDLRFAQFWYDLLASQPARTYLAEYKARKIAEQLGNNKINESQAINQLRQLKQIDNNNPVVLDLLQRIGFMQEAKDIDYSLKQGNLEEAVSKAKRSSNQQVRRSVADICFEILISGIKAHELSHIQIRQLANWIVELCPHDPEFQEIYRLTRLF